MILLDLKEEKEGLTQNREVSEEEMGGFHI